MKKTTVSAFAKRKASGEKLVMCTAYDAPFAAAVADAGIVRQAGITNARYCWPFTHRGFPRVTG